MSGLTLIVDDRGIGKQRYFQPNPTKENIQELDAKLENLNDIGLIFKAFYSYHYKPFTQYENPLVWFRDAIIKCKRMTGLQSDEDEALAFQDIKTLTLNSFNIQKRVCRGTKIICINANSYKHGRDCLCTIRRPPVEAKKKPVQNKRKKGSNSNGSTNKKRKKFVSTSDEESASDESSEMSDSDSDDDNYDSTSSGGQKVADIPQNKSTTARRRQSSNNLNSNDDITIARLQNLNQNLSDRNKALNKANEELLKEIELLKSNTNDEQLLAQNATLKKRLEKETKTFNSVKAQLSNQNATHTSRIHELELQLKEEYLKMKKALEIKKKSEHDRDVDRSILSDFWNNDGISEQRQYEFLEKVVNRAPSTHRFRPLIALWTNEEEKIKAKYAPSLYVDRFNNNNTNTNIGSGNMNHIGTKRRRQTRAFDLASAINTSSTGGNHQVSRRQSMW